MSRRVVWIVALALAGCSDVVVEDGDGSQGSASENATGSGELSGAGGASAADSEVPLDGCGKLCAARTDAGCAVAGLACLERCATERSHGSTCLATYDTWTRCRAEIAGAAVCDAPGAACPAERAAHEACVTPPGDCDERTCEPDGSGVSCLQVCGGRSYLTACTPVDDAFDCSCFIDGELVAACGDESEPTSRCCDFRFQMEP